MLAALVDCATSVVDADQQRQEQQQPPHARWLGQQQQQPRQQPQRRRVALQRAARVEVLQCLAECSALVLQHAPETQQQARLLVRCVTGALAGSRTQAVAALQLFSLVLRHVQAGQVSHELLLQVCAAPRHQMYRQGRRTTGLQYVLPNGMCCPALPPCCLP